MKSCDYVYVVDLFAGRKKYSGGTVFISEEEAVQAMFEGIRQRKILNESRSVLSYIKECQIEAEAKDKELKEVVDEGFLSGLLSGLAGATLGPKLGEAICKALNIKDGMLYNLLTSRVFLGAVCGYLGAKW